MPPQPRAVHIEGLRELRTAFRVAGTAMDKDLDSALKSAAEPVRTTAQALAVGTIRKIGIPWSRMRVGITRHTVYVAPVKRRGRYRRPNLFDLLRDDALAPALEQNRDAVEGEVKDAIRDMGRAWERV